MAKREAASLGFPLRESFDLQLEGRPVLRSTVDGLPCSRCHNVEAGTRLTSDNAAYVWCSVDNLNVARTAPTASMTPAMVVGDRDAGGTWEATHGLPRDSSPC
jgi:hypothetical protein